MKRLFLIHFILLSLCVYDADIIAYNTFHFYDTTNIELVDYNSFSDTDVYEICIPNSPEHAEYEKHALYSDCSLRAEIIRIQKAKFQEIRVRIQSLFITSRHSNSPTLLLS